VLTITSAPDDAYRYPDLTPQCEATFEWLEPGAESTGCSRSWTTRASRVWRLPSPGSWPRR